jgi:hypothetical protein
VNQDVFGRTNRSFPSIWLALQLPRLEDSPEGFEGFVARAIQLDTPLDISAAPAIFGSLTRQKNDVVLIQNSSVDFERASGSSHAADLVYAHLIETLSCIGRPCIDFYFLRSRVALEEAQLAGILETFEVARQEGHIRFLGLRIENFNASIANWQFHDAFDVVSASEKLSSEDRETARRMADQRRCGFILRTETLSSEIKSSEVRLLNVKDTRVLDELGVIA